MPTGTIKWFDERRGFGFIVADDGGPDVFVHQSVVRTEEGWSPAEGQPVEYEMEVSPKGPRALSVKLIGPS